jgi:hypothetical protein
MRRTKANVNAHSPIVNPLLGYGENVHVRSVLCEHVDRHISQTRIFTVFLEPLHEFKLYEQTQSEC